ncbi:hypothetical protein JQ616_17115 [Bradyrhizobium tropiciagri]|nr:hypothetical protein [Bradyrhizobium tropiciagri]
MPIVNRSEIAYRVIKTACHTGTEMVAFYAAADRNALHVEMADEAMLISLPAAAESDLLISRIVEACRKTGALTMHPGYAFPSEREAFPRAPEAAGVVFVGPNPGAIVAMSDKVESKRTAAKLIVDPWHIEIQVLGDKHGNVVYLSERECSIVRRSRKVIARMLIAEIRRLSLVCRMAAEARTYPKA